jgi:hypothetical protein
MKLFKLSLFVAIAVPIVSAHLLDPYTAQAPEQVAYYRVLEESDVRPTAVAMLLTGSTDREEVGKIAQDYASRYPDAEAVSIRIVDEHQEMIARAYYCFDISGAGTTGLSPGEHRFEYGEELEEERNPLMS